MDYTKTLILNKNLYNITKRKEANCAISNAQNKMNVNEPLAYRMSPKTLEDYVGQDKILGKTKFYTEQYKQTDYLA